VLVSPVGVPRSPYERATRESSEDLERRASKIHDDAQGDAEAMAAGTAPAEAGLPIQPKTWWTYLWEQNVSPFSILRYSTFLGPSLISRYAARRFATFPTETQQELFTYLYQISKDRGSGEYCLAHLLAPGAHARWPLIDRIGALKQPISFIYGEHDWMDEKGGHDCVKMLKNKKDSPDTNLQKLRSKVLINKHAGHWVHLENPDGFDKIIKKELADAANDRDQEANQDLTVD